MFFFFLSNSLFLFLPKNFPSCLWISLSQFLSFSSYLSFYPSIFVLFFPSVSPTLFFLKCLPLVLWIYLSLSSQPILQKGPFLCLRTFNTNQQKFRASLWSRFHFDGQMLSRARARRGPKWGRAPAVVETAGGRARASAGWSRRWSHSNWCIILVLHFCDTKLKRHLFFFKLKKLNPRWRNEVI